MGLPEHVVHSEPADTKQKVAVYVRCKDCGNVPVYTIPFDVFEDWRTGTPARIAFVDLPIAVRDVLEHGQCEGCFARAFEKWEP